MNWEAPTHWLVHGRYGQSAEKGKHVHDENGNQVQRQTTQEPIISQNMVPFKSSEGDVWWDVRLLCRDLAGRKHLSRSTILSRRNPCCDNDIPLNSAYSYYQPHWPHSQDECNCYKADEVIFMQNCRGSGIRTSYVTQARNLFCQHIRCVQILHIRSEIHLITIYQYHIKSSPYIQSTIKLQLKENRETLTTRKLS